VKSPPWVTFSPAGLFRILRSTAYCCVDCAFLAVWCWAHLVQNRDRSFHKCRTQYRAAFCRALGRAVRLGKGISYFLTHFVKLEGKKYLTNSCTFRMRFLQESLCPRKKSEHLALIMGERIRPNKVPPKSSSTIINWY